MKAVLISIRPEWSDLIVLRQKTLEVRKTRPKIDTPFKVYIYETKSYDTLFSKGKPEKLSRGKGRVIGEFICDYIKTYDCEFVDDDCYEYIAEIDIDEDSSETGFIEWANDGDYPYSTIFQKSCLSYETLKNYMGVGFNRFYGWEISKLIIYDKPKELNEFVAEMHLSKMERPPQSWCYVEEIKEAAEKE